MANRKQNTAANGKALQVETDGEESLGEAVARKINAPWTRHGLAALEFQGQMTRNLPAEGRPDFPDFANDLKKRAEKLGTGNLDLVVQALASQAITLDAIFTEMARRSGLNMGEYLDASERYMRLALRAQANSRATLETLIKLHQPREQTVRHVHVNDGGQAVVADHFHNHAGGVANAEVNEQSHATGAAGKRASLPSPHPNGEGVPIPSGQGPEPLPYARRNKSGSPQR